MPIARFHKQLPSRLNMVCRLNVGSDEYSKFSMTIAIFVQVVERRRVGRVTLPTSQELVCCAEAK
jgi:hypothetical protein